MNIALEQTEEYVNGQVCSGVCVDDWLLARVLLISPFVVEEQVWRCVYQRE